MSKLHLLLIPIILSFVFIGDGIAHEAGITDTNITIIKNKINIVYTVPLNHLPEIAGDDINKETIRHAIDSVKNGFEIKANNGVCKFTSSATRQLSEINARQFAYLYSCEDNVQSLQITYNLLYETDPAHKNFARVAFSGITENITFTNSNRILDINLASRTLKQTENGLSNQSLLHKLTAGSHFFPVGVEHILLGPDHLLFLAALILLPLRFKHIVALVTTFTISHSITLGLSALDIIVLKPGLVELVIALSIVYMAIESIFLLRRQIETQASKTLSNQFVYRRIALTALFGLIHGFGFSYILREIGLGDQVFSSLLFFNLGVEAGQLLALIIFLPLIAYLFKQLTTTLWAQAMALLIGGIGLLWAIERAFALLP